MSEGSTDRWSADRELNVPRVREAVTAQFPDIAATTIVPFGTGWDNDVFLIDDEWVFRFPRRSDVAATLDREIAATSLAATALSDLNIQVPAFAMRGRPGPGFPHTFSGYRRLPGRPAGNQLDGAEATALGREIGAALTRLHTISPVRAADAGLPTVGKGCKRWHEAALRVLCDLEDREPPEFLPCLDWVRSNPPIPSEYAGPARYLHNDLCPDHVLLDERAGVVSLLDFGDAALGDPALDFVMVRAWLGQTGTRAALSTYAVSMDSDLKRRVDFLARLTSLVWLHDAHMQETDVTKHRHWVRTAFAE